MSSLRPNSAADNRSKPRLHSASTVQQLNPIAPSSFGSYSGLQQRRPLHGNFSNTTSSMIARENLGGYNQNVGTMTQNGLRVLDGLLHNAT
jgi:hypothetical protein